MRYTIKQDSSPLDTGDLFSAECMPASTPDERATAAREYEAGVYDLGGPWGFITERHCLECGSWAEVDSCWGFDDRDYCESEAKASIDAMQD